MKIFKFPQILIFAITAVLSFVVFTSPAFAYEPNPTHRLLTQKTAQLFGGFSDEEINWLIQGAIEEDTPPRWVNHFYDPKTGQGWNSQRMSKIPQNILQIITTIGISPNPVSSLEWAHNQNLQAEYVLYQGDQTWETALYHYVRWLDAKNQEDKKKAFIALGHILHLLQDLSVPAHTRQDTHSSGDPYEQWAARFTSLENLDFNQIIDCPTLDDCFIQMAKYSQENFFSKETILDSDYPWPIYNQTANIDGIKFFLKDSYPLMFKDNQGNFSVEHNYIHSSYFQRLAPKAVATGISILRLFFQQAELGYQFPQTIKPPLTRGLNFPRFSLLGEILRLDNLFSNISQIADKIFSNLKSSPPLSSPIVTPPLLALSIVPPSPSSTPSITPSPQPAMTATPSSSGFSPSPPLSNSSSDSSKNLNLQSSPSPQVLGWQDSQNSDHPAPKIVYHHPAHPPLPTLSPSPPPAPPFLITPPDPPKITSHQDGEIVEEENIILRGIAKAHSLVFIEYQNQPATTTVSNEGQWQKGLLLNTDQEEHQLILRLQDPAGNQSAITSLTLILKFPNPPSSPHPEPHLLISEIQIAGQTSEDEFVELYNPTSQDIDLTGYQLKRATKNGKEELLVTSQRFAGQTIKSQGYFLLASPGYTGSITPDIFWPQSYRLAKDNALLLYNPQDQIIDKVGWGKVKVFETASYPENPSPNQSLERKALATSTIESMTTGEHQNQGNGYDSDNNFNDFILRPISNPQNSQSPIEPPSPPPPPPPSDSGFFSETFDNYFLGDLDGQGGWTKLSGLSSFLIQNTDTFTSTGQAVFAPIQAEASISYQKSLPSLTSGRFTINLKFPILTDQAGPHPNLISSVSFQEGTTTKFIIGTANSYLTYTYGGILATGGKVIALFYDNYRGYNDWINLGFGQDWPNQWVTLEVEFDGSPSDSTSGRFRLRYKLKDWEDFGPWNGWLLYSNGQAGQIDNILISTSRHYWSNGIGESVFDDFSLSWPLL